MDKALLKYYSLITILVVASMGIIYISGPGSMYITGMAILELGTPDNTVFTTPSFQIECAATTLDNLINISARATHEKGQKTITSSNVSGQTNSTNLTFSNMRNGDYTYNCIACDTSGCDESQSQSFKVNYTATQAQIEPVLNLSFDNTSDPWVDYSNLFHSFTNHGSISSEPLNNCKWFGCADLTATSDDFLESIALFTTNEGLSVSFWIYLTEEPTGANSQAFYQLGQSQNTKFTQEGDYGLNTQWAANSGQVGGNTNTQYATSINSWNHYFISYDESIFRVWKNGELIKQEAQSYGNLNNTLYDILYIGKGPYGIDATGYIDEFLIYNRGNFSTTEIKEIYDSRALGTPPEIDLYVKNVTYILPYDWSSQTNDLDLSGNMNIEITIANAGVSVSSGEITTKLYLDGTQVCSETSTLTPQSEIMFNCSWPKSVGWHTGHVVVDSENSISESEYIGGTDDNNNYSVIIPMENHPRFRFNSDEWDNTFEPIFTDSNNEISYNAYTWYKSFVSEDFNPSWSVTDVDPRAKKGYTNAVNCYLNGYESSTACTYARNHLEGWLNNIPLSDWETGSVQSLHEVIHVAATYDLMFPDLTESEAKLYGKRLQEICLAIYGREELRLHNDADEPALDNGKGFGMGMAGPCYIALGDESSNPNMMWDDPQTYTDIDTIANWNKRMENYLKGFKDDPNAIYPEGMLYQWYSRYHLVDTLWFVKRTNISSITEKYQNAICSFTNEVSRNMLDHTYNGNILRGDEGNTWRQISYGDTNSYEIIGSDGIHGWDVISAYGLLCDDTNTKKIALKLREIGYDSGASTRSPGALYFYTKLTNEVSAPDTIDEITEPYSFAKSFDRLTIRRGFSYINDTVFIIDGGDEAAGGHPAADFNLFAYVYGEPFLDYPQVPYEDDVRSEVWTNSISFIQSEVSGYNTDVGESVLNQIYGGKSIEGSYPNFNFFPAEYAGDVLDTIGTSDGLFAAAHTYKPYAGATSPVIRDYVIFDDLLVHTDYVKRSSPGSTYANWINIYDEFTPTMAGNKLTFQRVGTDKYYEIDLMWSNIGESALTGGDSGKQYCFKKTSCTPGGNGNYGKYYHEINGSNTTALFAHHWYQGSDDVTIALYNSVDKGIIATYSDHTTSIKFDTNEDNSISIGDYTASGWSLSATIGVIAATGTTSITLNSTTVYESDINTSVYLDYTNTGFINGTISTPESTEISIYLSGSESASLTVDGQAVSSSQYTVIGGVLTTTIASGNHHILINKGEDVSPTVILDEPPEFFFSSNSSMVSFSCNVSDDFEISYIELLTNESGSLDVVLNESTTGTTTNYIANRTFTDGNYEWTCRATDNSSQQTTANLRIFSLGEIANTAPVINTTHPLNSVSTYDTTITFNCSATDSQSNLQTITLMTNTTGIFTDTYSIAASGNVVNLSKSLSINYGTLVWGCKATDNLGLVSMTENNTLLVLLDTTPPNRSSFNGDTTDFSELPSLINVSNVTLENTTNGKIYFSDLISNLASVNLDSAINISPGNITVDTTTFSQLNVSANLSFYNINFDNPIIKKDGELCTVCTNIIFSGSTYSFTVPHFSSYSVEEEIIEVVTTTESTTQSTSSNSGEDDFADFDPSLDSTATIQEKEDFSGTNVETTKSENNQVKVTQTDQEEQISTEQPTFIEEDVKDTAKGFSLPIEILITIILGVTIIALLIYMIANPQIKIRLKQKIIHKTHRIANSPKKKVTNKIKEKVNERVDNLKTNVYNIKTKRLAKKVVKASSITKHSRLKRKYKRIIKGYDKLKEKDKVNFYEPIKCLYEDIKKRE